MQNMARSAKDATRFTPTTPHATAKRSSSLPTRFPGPPGETPQEKIRRLRAAADKARDAQFTTFDKIVIRGRVWADRAHRFTALFLIGSTFVAGGITVYAMVDMSIYNRRKKAEFFREQKARHAYAIESAREKIAAGIATEEDINFIQLEDEHEIMLRQKEEEKKNKKGIFGGAKSWLLSGLKKEEEGEDLGSSESRLGYEGLSEEDDEMGERESDILKAIEARQDVVKNKVKKAFADEKEKQRTGGPLDRVGNSSDTREDEKPRAGGWTSFMTRR
ncbi:hypothetical protein B7494_g1112 [Chlorociboria aeruginascens]|nr:hypothetical protein B7494_g1112 [Chlorociboria aeruginascens]